MDWQTALADPRILGGLGAVLLILAVAAIAWRRRRNRQPVRRLRAVALDLLQDIVIPDGDGGQVHVEIAMLTPVGIVLADLREVDGHVFGSNAMQDWTVLSDRRRFTFANPQHALLDRVAAVRRLLPNTNVRGLVVFTERARFTKGLPEYTAELASLIDELRQANNEPEANGLREAWDRLRSEAVTAQVGRLIDK
jgi:hypothetical protein